MEIDKLIRWLGLNVSMYNVLTGVAAYNVVTVVLAFLEYPVATVVTLEYAVSRCIKPRQTSPQKLSVQELCESRGGRPGLFVLMSLTVSVDVKQHRNRASALVTICP